MEKQTETELPRPAAETETTSAATAGRRAFIAKLAKAAIVPAIIVGVAANASPAHASY
jgi:hypothetical protein